MKKDEKFLIKTGNDDSPWYWRDGEIQVAQFRQLTSTAKQEHIQFLLTLPKEHLSTNDEYILKWHGPKLKTNNFITLID